MSFLFRPLALFTLAFLVACSDASQDRPGTATASIEDSEQSEANHNKSTPKKKDKSKKRDREPQVRLSKASGFYDAPFTLHLSHPDPDAAIYFTLDGSDPDPANTQGSTYRYKNLYSYRRSDPFGDFLEGRYQTLRYEKPIRIEDRSDQSDRFNQISTSLQSGPPRYFPQEPSLTGWKQLVQQAITHVNQGIGGVNHWLTHWIGEEVPQLPTLQPLAPEEPRELLKATVVRAVAVKDGQRLGPARTATYFVMPRSTFNLPVISLVAQEDRLFGYDEGILVAGRSHDAFRQNHPAEQRAMGNAPANWMLRGVEVPAHFQFFPIEQPSDQAAVDQGVGIRVHGGVNRAAPSKALRIYARKAYGAATLKYAFFGEEQKYKRLLLRNSGNDFYSTFMRDAVAQQAMAGLRFDTQAYRPAVVFLNGEYWGLLNLREYYSKHYLARVYKVDEDRLDIMDLDKADEGDDAHWRSLMAYVEAHPLSDPHHFAHVASQIDIDNFIDYHIANLFAANYDWPHNNVRYWRAKVDQPAPHAAPGHDGRWRWLMFDMDDGFKRTTGVALKRILSHNDAKDPKSESRARSSLLFRRLLQNKSFEERFVSRFADTLNAHFAPEHLTAIVDHTKSQLAPEMPRHINRWKIPADLAEWNKNTELLSEFAEKRTPVMRSHLVRQFKLGAPYQLNVDVSDPAHGKVRVNTLTLDEQLPGVQASVYPWVGQYFKNVPVELEALPNTCFAFSHWEGDSRSSSRISLRASEDVSVRAVFTRTCEAG